MTEVPLYAVHEPNNLFAIQRGGVARVGYAKSKKVNTHGQGLLGQSYAKFKKSNTPPNQAVQLLACNYMIH